MKSTEFRLGNYVSIISIGEIKKIMEILHDDTICLDMSGIGYVSYHGLHSIDQIEGIGITADTLLKIGFSQMNNSIFKQFSPHLILVFDTIEKTFELKNEKSDFTIKDITDIKLHQLQNLYFALTGDELSFS